MKYGILAIFAAMFLFSACSSTKEEVKPLPPPVVKEEKKPEMAPPEREFTYTDRYYVQNAVISDPTEVKDALQALRVIQLEAGNAETLVISSFDKKGDSTLETWLGIELPSFAPGIYELSTARKIAFYRFYLGDDRKRIDGSSSEGKIKIESNQDGELIGSINAIVNATMKAFDQQSQDVKVTFTGSFRIKQVDLENTMMKTR